MKTLVTGAAGFSARHLIEYLRGASSAEIWCSSLKAAAEKNWFPCELANEEATWALIEQIRPDQLYHLAGRFSNDYHTDYSANVLSTRNLLESVLRTKRSCRVLLIGSSAEYGVVAARENPVKENYPLAPASIYGLTKVYQTYLMKFYCSIHNMDLVMARPFNLLGKGMSSKLFVGRVYKQIEAYKGGRIEKIVVGDLENRRDYLEVEQAVRYYSVIMQQGEPGGIYNVGSGTSTKLRDLLKRILEENELGMDVVEERALKDTNKLDIKDLVADISRLKSLMDP